MTEPVVWSLDKAINHFTNLYIAKHSPRKIAVDVSIKAKYENLGRQFYEKAYELGEKGNPYPLPIKQQVQFEKKADRPVARVISVKMVNQLGMDDNFYYYVLFRPKGWYRSWARIFDFKKYLGSEGIYIPHVIIEHIFKNKVIEQSRIVVVNGDGEIWMAPSKDIDSFFLKYGKAFVNAYSQICSGYPKELFKKFEV